MSDLKAEAFRTQVTIQADQLPGVIESAQNMAKAIIFKDQTAYVYCPQSTTGSGAEFVINGIKNSFACRISDKPLSITK